MVQIHPSLPSSILVVIVLGLQAVERGLQASVGCLFTRNDGRLLAFKSGTLGLEACCVRGNG